MMTISYQEKRRAAGAFASDENMRGKGREGGKRENSELQISMRSSRFIQSAVRNLQLTICRSRLAPCWPLLLFAWLAAVSSFLPEAYAADSAAWQMSPYRMQILTAFEPAPALTTAIQKSLCEDLLTRIEAVVGAPWDTTVAPAPSIQRSVMLQSLDGITMEQAMKIAANSDKLMFLVVKVDNGAIQVAVREFDVRSQQFGPPSIRTAWHLGKLRDTALDSILAAFSPLANIESVKMTTRTTILHLKAAGLPSRDPALAIIQPGMIFRPYIRVNNRDGSPKCVTPVAWTFLVVENAAMERLDCRIESGMSMPLNVKRRARIEQLALAIHPARTPSVLLVQSRIEPKAPLPGYLLFDYDKETKAYTLLGRTDWQGRISIAPNQKVLRSLAIKNGSELLARVPFVPGLDPMVMADIANDDYRLQAEGFVIGLQEELVDMYVHRELLRKGALAKIDVGDIDQAKALHEELSRLPGSRTFLTKLTEERKKLDTKDPVITAKIDKLFAETQKIVDKCIDDKIVDALAQDIRDAKHGVKKKDE